MNALDEVWGPVSEVVKGRGARDVERMSSRLMSMVNV